MFIFRLLSVIVNIIIIYLLIIIIIIINSWTFSPDIHSAHTIRSRTHNYYHLYYIYGS